jgi:hypothetical protein
MAAGLMMALLLAVAADPAAAAANDPTGRTLSPWVVLSAEGVAGTRARVPLNGHYIFTQRAVPARIVRTSAPLTFEGVTLPAGSILALASNLKSHGAAWCALPAPGGSELTHRSLWGKRETRCFADTDGDGRLDTGYFGKLDLLGLPSVRDIKRPVPLATPIATTEGDPRAVEGFFVKGTIFYFDMSKNRRSPCMSFLPFHLKNAGSDPASRRLAVALTRDDGTACYSNQSAILRPDSEAVLPGAAGDTLSFGGATIRVDRLGADAMDVTILSTFEPYAINARTETMAVDF